MIGVGIVGCGGIARAHAGAYAQFPDRCRIVAVADIFKGQADRLAAEVGGGATPLSDPRELLARDDVALVSVCTPPFEHAPLAVAALGAGKHALVEKPMATSLQECDEMIEAASASRRLLSVIHQNRFRPDYARLRALVQASALGPLDLVAVNCLWWRGPEYYRRWWRGTWDQEGGGALLNHAVHAVDLVAWIAGMPESVSAVTAIRAHAIEVDDLATAIMRFPGGAVGQFTGTVDAHLNIDRFEVCGRDAAVAVPWRVAVHADQGDGFGRPDADAVARIETLAAAVSVSRYKGHAAQVELLLRAIETGSAPPVPGAEARRAVELITAMYVSSAEGQACALPLPSSHPCHSTEGFRDRMRRALRTAGT